MKTLKSKLLILLAFTVMAVSVLGVPIQAASGTMSITVSNANVNAGDNFTVTVSYTGSTVLAYANWTLKYDNSLVSCGGYGGSIPDRFDPDQSANAKSFSQTYTFTAKAVGTVSFSIADEGVYNLYPEDGDLVTLNKSGASVKISAKGSSNANLSSLKLSAGSLSPSFSNDVSSYTVTVPNSVASISISAVAADSKARVSVSGANEVPVGDSSRVVIVTAEDGTVKKFTIHINRAASVPLTPIATATPVTTPMATSGTLPVPTTDPSNLPGELEVTASGAVLTIVDKPDTVTLPVGFTEIQYTYKSRQVWAAQAENQELIILYLQDEANEKSGFYVYDEVNDEFSKYIILYTRNSSYTLLQLPEIVAVPEGYVEKIAVLDGENVTVWVPESMKYMEAEICEFYLVYAMNQNGDKGFYVYDTVEQTFQRFSSDIGLPVSSPVPDDPEATPAPDVVNPDGDPVETGLWDSCKAFFSRIFSGEARAVDWLLFSLLLFMVLLIVVLILFIVYAVQKHREEAVDEDFPLAKKEEGNRNFRRTNLFEIEEVPIETEEPEKPEPAEELPDAETDSSEEQEVPEEPPEEIETQESAEAESTYGEAVPWEDTPAEPQDTEVLQQDVQAEPEPETENEAEAEENTEAEKETDPFDFNIEDLKKAEGKPWGFDDEIGDDFFNEDQS